MKIKFFAVGGTIDKVYFDLKSDYKVGSPGISEILKEANVTFDYECVSLLRKDSLDMTDDDREMVCKKIADEECRHIIVTHGTDTMIETARELMAIPDKTIVMTGSMQPARFKWSDAEFNVGTAVGAVQSLAPGVYIAMNGRIFSPDKVRKNRRFNRFEEIE
ncbi:MAG: asparaginase domain-containing protein [Desulfomonilia bacterium]|nr:asparaginase domain-containing protein [Desulfomonilia bacterium]